MTVPTVLHAAEPQVVVGPREHVVDDVLRQEPREDVVDPGALEVVQPLLRQARVDPRAQDHRIERLREVVVGAGLDAANDAVDLVDRRDHDHRDVLGARASP